MLAQKFLELIGIKIGKHSVARNKGWNISLLRKPLHLCVRLSISADINDTEAVPFLGEILLRVNAPRAPFATVKLQFHGNRGNKQECSASSIANEWCFPSRRRRPVSRSSVGAANLFEEVCDGRRPPLRRMKPSTTLPRRRAARLVRQ
jgi:hypothetical protein